MTATAPIERGIVEKQLERVLASSQFSETTRLARFLDYVVRQTLDGNTEGLKGYAIGLDVFDKAEDFDPSIDTIVRVQAGKLRTRLDLFYAGEGRDDPLRILIPKGSYVPVFELALDPERSGGVLPTGGDPATTARASLAVMPFDNLSGDPGQEFLADGFTEEIIDALSRFREIRVVSRHATFRYKNRPVDPRELADDLDVQFLLEGSVRRWQDQLRITARFVEAKSGRQLASDAYDREMSAQSLFDIQQEIAAQIAAEIGEPFGVIHRIGTRRRAGTQALDAYECRLLASEYWRAPTEAEHKRVAGLLERAVAIDPDYAGAWAMLAIVHGDEARAGFNLKPGRPALDRALEAAQRAVDLDPANATGYYALFLTCFNRGEFERFEAAAAKALQLNPNYPDMLADLGSCRAFSGDWKQGLAMLERAIDLSPNPPGWYRAARVLNHYRLQDYEAALAEVRLMGDSLWDRQGLFELMILGQMDRDAETPSLSKKILEDIPRYSEFIQRSFTLWHLPQDLQKKMLEGWHKAGLVLEFDPPDSP
ncbi:tetratricopeptide repeat protein [Hoeflea sp.]|uniref:tetratricopeptide repeat protein n=1 Tax=Hoeflea sp. TaxID=1940281 RepID=UPI003B01407B